jgi:uncharacterized membrane protein
MQCPQCHTEVGAQSAFCGNCGATLSAPAPEAVTPPAAYIPPPAAAPGAGYAAPPVAAQSSGLTPNAAAAISYITVVPAILFLVMDPYKKMPLVRFHAFQCIAIAVTYIVLVIAAVIVMMVLAFIPGIRVLALILAPIVYFGLILCTAIVVIMAIIKASKGEWFKVPFIGDFAMKMSQGSN